MGTLVIKSRREASEWRVTQADMCLDSRWAQKSPEETHRSRLHGSRRQAVDPSRDVETGALVGGVERCLGNKLGRSGHSLLGDRRQRHATAEVETAEDGDSGAWPSGLPECSVMPVET